MADQAINCNVTNCKHNNDNHMCTLSNIVVGSDNSITSMNSCVGGKCETECVNFEAE